MRLLVFSDSHSALRFMRQCVDSIRPDGIIHLGDHFDDGEVLKEEYPHIRLWQVPGNCDRYRVPDFVPEILVERIFGVDFFLTHGHRHNVKLTLSPLLVNARKCGVSAVLYGHTHRALCHREEDGLWVMNPGSCGYGGGSAGLIELEKNEIKSCKIISGTDLEELV